MYALKLSYSRYINNVIVLTPYFDDKYLTYKLKSSHNSLQNDILKTLQSKSKCQNLTLFECYLDVDGFVLKMRKCKS